MEICLTDFREYSRPLFRPGFLGDKWPAIDYYVELRNVRGATPYFFAQVKTTPAILARGAQSIRIAVKERDVARLRAIPGPTYVLAVHEPSQRVFVRSVFRQTPVHGMNRIPTSHELTPARLRVLYDEVRGFWKSAGYKPETSVFA